MQIKVNLKILVFILVFLISNQIKIYGIIMFFSLIHELGHLIVGLIVGFKPTAISIKPTGISISFEVVPNNINKKIINGNILAIKKIFIALAGPLVNLIIAILLCNNNIHIFNISKEILIYSNLLIGIFNLIPIYPLDGGRILKELIHIIKGLKRSYIITYKISNAIIIFLTVLSSIAILYLKNISILFIIAYLWGLVIIENKRYREKMIIYNAIEKMR